MPLIKDGRLVDDRFVTLDDEAALPDEDKGVIVSLTRWRAEREPLRRHNLPLGVRLKSDQQPGEIAGDLDRLSVVALEFPKFTDGRAYTSARLLRERYGFEGELRAVGNVLQDQFLFMHRCGFDAFEVADARAAESWAKAVSAITVRYQHAADRRVTAAELRHRRAGSWAY